MSAHKQNPKEKAAVLTLKLRADSGYEADAEYRISAEQWGEVLGICEGTRSVPALPVNARLLEALKQARHAVINNAFPIGWSVDRLSEVIAAAESQVWPARLTEAEIGQIDRQSRDGLKPQAKGD